MLQKSVTILERTASKKEVSRRLREGPMCQSQDL